MFTFMGEHPFLTFCLVAVCAECVSDCVQAVARGWARSGVPSAGGGAPRRTAVDDADLARREAVNARLAAADAEADRRLAEVRRARAEAARERTND